MIPYGRQSIDEDDIEAVVAVLRGDMITQGPAIEEFEASLCASTGAAHAVAFSNGTAALHGAVAAAGIGTGDLLVTTPLTFVASANCGKFVGASTGFVDIEPETLNLNPTRIPRNADALVAVHFAGLPVELERLNRRPRVVIEDAAHALGATTPDGPVGNCAHSDMTTFSFHPVKPITTGEGGAVTTNDAELAERLRRFRSHGVMRDPAGPAWIYDVVELGYNYRLTDLQAALGRSQLTKLDRFIDARNAQAATYADRLAGLDIELAPEPRGSGRHGRHLYPIRVGGRDRVAADLRDRGIGVQLHYVPVHLHSLYRADGWKRGDFPLAEHAADRLLSLPIHPSLKHDELENVLVEIGAAVAATSAESR